MIYRTISLGVNLALRKRDRNRGMKKITKKDRQRILAVKGCVFFFCVIGILIFFKIVNAFNSPIKSDTSINKKSNKKNALQTVNTKSEEDKSWKITQYGDKNSKKQYSFYTITDEKGNLTVIDGGWESNADDVRNVIYAFGNKVDTWILTHPHPDHIGAFMSIYEDARGIKIDHIYAPEIDYPAYEAKKETWDDFSVFQKFYDLTQTMPQLEYVKEGDNLDVMGLSMKVFNAYNNSVDSVSQDLANDGSIVFKMSGKETNMLFLSDVGNVRNDYLLQTYGQELKSDYLQMGHHGNSSLTDIFYQTIAPKAVFFDAPDWLISGNEFSTQHYMSLMENMKSEIFDFSTGPNSVVLR